MTHVSVPSRAAEAPPRSVGFMRLHTKYRAGTSGIDRFRTSGASKVAFPRRADAVEAIMLNTSGGLTGGDRFEAHATAGPGSRLILTTQAAERGYRSNSGSARVTTHLIAEECSVLHWLPQELILFDGASVDRRLNAELAPGARLVIVEPIVFGRRAMGETVISGHFHDRITVARDGQRLFSDAIRLDGPIHDLLSRPAIAGGMTALASALYCGPDAEAHLSPLRDALPATGGVSLVAPDLLVIRLLATEALTLRRALVPALEILTGGPLPKSWSL